KPEMNFRFMGPSRYGPPSPIYKHTGVRVFASRGRKLLKACDDIITAIWNCLRSECMGKVSIGIFCSALLLLTPASRAAGPVRVMLLDGESGGTYHNWQLITIDTLPMHSLLRQFKIAVII